MHITLIEATNFKRLKAVRIEPSAEGLTIISGKNSQGKTSVLDAIAFAFGGKKYCPSNPKRSGAVGDTMIRIETDNGLIIERKGKNLDLSVTDSTGKRQGQALLDAFISEFAINLPKFLNSSDKEKANTLLQILGIGDQLEKLDRDEKAKYDQRTIVGREADRKKKHADEMPWYEDAPEEEQSVASLIQQQQEILSRNGIKEEHRRNLDSIRRQLDDVRRQIKTYEESLASFRSTESKLAKAVKEAESEDFTLEPTDEIKAKIDGFEETNRKIRANKDRESVLSEADTLQDQYDMLTGEIEDIRKKRIELLNGADLPYPGLTIENGVLLLDGKAWDCFSSSQQLIVGTAIASRLNPDCKFVLLDKLEQLDDETLKEFDKWLCEHGIQSIATRVSSDKDASLIIEDGEVVEGAAGTVVVPKKPKKEDDADDWD